MISLLRAQVIDLEKLPFSVISCYVEYYVIENPIIGFVIVSIVSFKKKKR